MMNIVHTKRLEKYLVDLRDYISQEILSNYTSKILSEIDYFKNKLIGLVILMIFFFFNIIINY